jgi:hypothetical protein
MTEKQDRSIGELFSDLARETAELIRQEIALAKIEFGQKAKHVGVNIRDLVVGGAVAYAAFLVLLAAIIAGLAEVMPIWAAALIVAVLVGIVAAVLVSKALTALRRIDLTPQATVQTLKEDAQWVKKQMK